MPDPRFFGAATPQLLGELARIASARLNDPASADLEIVEIAAPDAAGPTAICLFMDKGYAAAIAASKAGAVITSDALAPLVPASIALVLSAKPRLAYALIAAAIHAPPTPPPGIAPTATIDPSASLSEGCSIGAGVVVGAHAVIGRGTRIDPHGVIGDGVVIGADGRIGAHAVISHAVIGDRFVCFPNVSIGRPGFGFVPGPAGIVRVPQLGRVVIGHDVEIGASTTVDRGALDDTVIGDGCKIDNGVQIAHNVRLGRFCILAGHTGISGSTKLGNGVVVGGGVVFADHITVGDGAQIAASSVVSRDLDAGTAVGGNPAIPIRRWHRQVVALAKLAERPKPDAS